MKKIKGLMLVYCDCFHMRESLGIGYTLNPDIEEGLEVLKSYLRKYD